MAIKKLGAKSLNGAKEVKKSIFEEPTIEDVMEDEVSFEDNDEVYDEDVEDVYEAVEEEDAFDEEPVKVPAKATVTKGSTPKVTKPVTKKAIQQAAKQPQKQSSKPANSKKQMMKKKGEKVEKKQAVSESNVYKRDSLLKDVISDLDELGYEMTLEGMSTIMSSIEKNILSALEKGYRITLLGNQIKPQERNARISKAPNSEYATLTDKYTAFVWSRTPNDKTVIKGTKNDDGTFTDLEGNVYAIDENGDIVQQ